MITRCFENNANYVDVTKCQTPSEYCARCNKDDSNISLWTSIVKFDIDIAFFANNSRDDRLSYPEAYNVILNFISKTGNTIFTPPFPQDKLCFRKKHLKTCTDSRNKPTGSWIEKACERIYSPLMLECTFGRRIPFLNVFVTFVHKSISNRAQGGNVGIQYTMLIPCL